MSLYKKRIFKNTLTEIKYEGYVSGDSDNAIPFFKKSVAKEIMRDTNRLNQNISCNIFFLLDGDNVVCRDNEFHKRNSSYPSHMIYTENGLMKLYNFGNEIVWE